METPSSSRRVTRSAAFNSSIRVEGKKEGSKTRTGNGKHKQQRSALIDITNDSSPIAGLAMETPSSVAGGKQRSIGAKNVMMMTPGSGEALLRCQVKTLLRKVEEEAEVSKLPLEGRPFFHLQSSPVGILAPVNTPQVFNASEDAGLMDLPVVQEQLKISEMVSGNFESQNYMITRSLLMDFAEKSDGGDGESSATKEKTLGFPDDEHDDASVWSIQVNASTHDEDDETFEEMEDYYHKHEEEEEHDDGLVDELCKGVSKMSMTETFIRKHMRFVYNSDGEIEEESTDCSTDIIRLKGLPTPKGKHLRFPLEEDP